MRISYEDIGKNNPKYNSWYIRNFFLDEELINLKKELQKIKQEKLELNIKENK